MRSGYIVIHCIKRRVFEVPVIAVPILIGYGLNMNDLSSNIDDDESCAKGIAVVSFNNGYGAGYMVM